MRILFALGGNALRGRGNPARSPNQRRHIEAAAAALARIATEHEMALFHCNGSRVKLSDLQNETFPDVAPNPLDVLDAEAEGMVDHILELALRNALPDRDVISVLSEVVVAADDPAFLQPSHPVGPVYSAEQARLLRLDRGWEMGHDDQGYRRLVPSPEPHAIAEIRGLRVLLDSGALVICARGGGIPVALDGLGRMREVEAAVDRDLTAALLARRLDADLLVMVTDVDSVHADWGGPDERPLAEAEPTELRAMDLAPTSMGPKVEAACRFANADAHFLPPIMKHIEGLRCGVRQIDTSLNIHLGQKRPAIFHNNTDALTAETDIQDSTEWQSSMSRYKLLIVV